MRRRRFRSARNVKRVYRPGPARAPGQIREINSICSRRGRIFARFKTFVRFRTRRARRGANIGQLLRSIGKCAARRFFTRIVSRECSGPDFAHRRAEISKVFRPLSLLIVYSHNLCVPCSIKKRITLLQCIPLADYSQSIGVLAAELYN